MPPIDPIGLLALTSDDWLRSLADTTIAAGINSTFLLATILWRPKDDVRISPSMP